MSPRIFKEVPIDDLHFDPTNPRIKHLIDGVSLTDFIQALISYDPSFKELQAAIRQYGGIINPIKVNNSGNQMIVFEGNTRLAIYHQFRKNYPDEKQWCQIPCTIYDELSQAELDRLRLQDHMIGTRAWTPYAKAAYLHELHFNLEPMAGLVEFCGGNRSKVMKMIEAYLMMENTYKTVIEDDPELDETSFDEQKFTAFEEFQQPKRQRSLHQRGHDERDFARWVARGLFHRNEDVRKLPEIMENDQAYKQFLQHGSREATRYLVTTDGDLTRYSLAALCKAVYAVIRDIKKSEIEGIKSDGGQAEAIDDAVIELISFKEVYLDSDND